MAFIFNINNTPATGAGAIFLLKELLKSASWVVTSSSDATTYFANSDGLTSSGSSTAGLGNSNAWFLVQMSGTSGGTNNLVKQFTFQRGTTDLVWRVKLSVTGTFTLATAGATITKTPFGTDEVILLGGGTDATPTFATLFGTNGTYRWHAMADNASPFGWYSVAYPTGGGNPNHCLMLDPLLSGTYPPEDVDPYMYYFTPNGNTMFNGTSGDFISETAAPRGFLGLISGSKFVNITPQTLVVFGSSQTFPAGLPVNPWNSKDDTFPVFYARRLAAVTAQGYKGQSSFMRFNAVSRITGDTLSTVSSGSNDRIIITHVTLPWSQSVNPLI
jgi:hypothetical protein